MFGLFSRKTSAPVTATVRTTGSLFQARAHRSPAPRPPRASEARSLSLIGREARRSRVPEDEPELGLDRDARRRRGGSARWSRGWSGRARATSHSTVTASWPGSISSLKLTMQRPTTYSSRPIPCSGEEAVAALLEVGEGDRVVDVAEAVDVAPAHLHPVAAVEAHAPSPSSIAERLAQRRRAAHQVERVGAAVGRVAAADQQPQVGGDAVGGERGGAEAGRHREEEDGAAVGGEQLRGRLAAAGVDDDDGEVGRRRRRPRAARRRRRAGRAGRRRRRRRRGPARSTRATAAASTSTATTGGAGGGVAGGGERQLAGVAGAEHADAAGDAAPGRGPGRRRRRRRRARPRRRRRGRRGPAPRRRGRRRRRCRATPTWAEAGSTSVTASSRSGVSVSEPSETIALAERGRRRVARRRRRRRCRAGRRRSRSPGCASCRARRRSPRSASAILLGSPPAPSRISRCEVESRQRRLDRDLDLVRAHRAGGVEPGGRLRQRPARLEHPVGAELLADVGVGSEFIERPFR